MKSLKHKRGIFITIAILLIISFSGCDKASDFFSYQEEVQYEVVDRAYLSMDRIKSLNPVLSKDKDVYHINKLLYPSLFQLDEQLLAENNLVESYHFDVNKSTLTMTLKSGVKWSSGEEVTSNDVKFSIDAYKRAALSNVGIYGKQVANIGSVAIDQNTVIIKYLTPVQISLENLTFPIISGKSFKDLNAVFMTRYNYVPVTSGQYRIDSYNPFSQLVLKGDPNYRGNQASNEIIFKIIPKISENLNLIEPNLITLAFSDKMTRDVDFANLDAEIQSYLSNEAEWVGFNMAKKNLQDVKVRKAIAQSIDTQELVEAAYYGNAVLTDSLYYPDYWGIKNTGSIFEMDEKKAQELLTSAGYRDLNSDGLLEDKDGNDLNINILINAGDASREIVANHILENLKKLKVAAIITSLEKEAYIQAIYSGNYDIYIGGAKMGENYDCRPLLKSYAGNPVNYVNPDLDLHLDQLQSALSSEEKIKIYVKIKKILMEEIPYYPLVYKTYGVIKSKDFLGEIHPRFDHKYAAAETWALNHKIETSSPEEETSPNQEEETSPNQEGGAILNQED